MLEYVKEVDSMDHLNFIFTKNGFHIDEVNDSAWAELFKENKYAALYELGFKII